MSNTKYLLDTNVLIEASKRYYAFDLVETFWQHLAHRSQDGIIKSIYKVKAEIHPENIPLINWAVDHPSLWESTIAQDTKDKYQQLMEWADASKQYHKHDKEKFAVADNADAWLIAHALANKRVIVTEERFNKDIKRRIPIPNVCKSFKIECVDTFQMLHDLKIKLA